MLGTIRAGLLEVFFILNLKDEGKNQERRNVVGTGNSIHENHGEKF